MEEIYEKKLKIYLCKISLDNINEPVVTLCGHLYCWNCIFMWYKHKNIGKLIVLCPTCNFKLNIKKIIPLYTSKEEHLKKVNIPNNIEKKINYQDINYFEFDFLGVHYHFNHHERFYILIPIILLILTPNISYVFNLFFDYLIYNDENNIDNIKKYFSKLIYDKFYIEMVILSIPVLIMILILILMIIYQYLKNKLLNYLRR